MIFVKLLLLRHQKLPPKIASQNLKKPLYFFIKNSVFVLILLIVHIMDQKKSHFPMICNNLLKKGITILHWIMYIPRVYAYKNSTLKIFFTHPHRQCFSWWERKIATIADKKKKFCILIHSNAEDFSYLLWKFHGAFFLLSGFNTQNLWGKHLDFGK